MRQKWFRGEADGGSEGKEEEIELCGPKRDLICVYVEYELELFRSETQKSLLLVGCADRSMRQKASGQWP